MPLISKCVCGYLTSPITRHGPWIESIFVIVSLSWSCNDWLDALLAPTRIKFLSVASRLIALTFISWTYGPTYCRTITFGRKRRRRWLHEHVYGNYIITQELQWDNANNGQDNATTDHQLNCPVWCVPSGFSREGYSLRYLFHCYSSGGWSLEQRVVSEDVLLGSIQEWSANESEWIPNGKH